MSKQISDDIKQFSYEICQKHKVIIRYMETDKDHIHYMIETEPAMSISKIVNPMKSYTPKSLFWSLNSLLKGARSLYNQRLALIWQFSDHKNIITKLHLA